jgi:nickel-dependent lactate racemase
MSTRRKFLAGVVTASAAYSSPGRATAEGERNSIRLRTHEWFGDKVEEFKFPPGWRIAEQRFRGHDAPVLSAEQIRQAILAPVGAKQLRDIAAGKKTVAIAVDDFTRPTPTRDIIPHVVAELSAAGIKDENILFVMAGGAHYKVNNMEAAKKLGLATVRRHPWINHNIWEMLVELGSTSQGNQVFINSYYHKADIKITLSGMKGHNTLGVGGGAKLILPGVAGMKSIRYMHFDIGVRRPWPKKNGQTVFTVAGNPQRRDMVEFARRTGVEFSVQICYNQDRKVVNVVAGDIEAAHHRAARYTLDHVATEPARQADLAVVNAYPKGQQVFEHLRWGPRGLKDGGSIVIINQQPMGEYVWHYMNNAYAFQRSTGDYFHGYVSREPRFPMASQVLYYSQYAQAWEAPAISPDMIAVRSWDEVIAHLKKQHKGDVQVAVYPYAGIQHEVGITDLPEEA